MFLKSLDLVVRSASASNNKQVKLELNNRECGAVRKRKKCCPPPQSLHAILCVYVYVYESNIIYLQKYHALKSESV
jgi:hypothetical protein